MGNAEDTPPGGMPARSTAAGGRVVEGPEDFNAYERRRVEQADKALKLAKIGIGATVAVGATAMVLSGLNLGADSGSGQAPGQ